MDHLGHIFLFTFLFIFLALDGQAASSNSMQALEKDNQQVLEKGLQVAQLYKLPAGQSIKEITQEVLRSPLTTETQKADLLQYGRRILLFEYPSDGLRIKGVISFTPQAEHNPLLIFLRGGNKTFGLGHPAMDITNYKNYTTLATTYRDGVSEGQDQFGGEDVDDVNNLVNFIPILEQELHLNLHQNPVYMLGASRGGLEMFLALACFPELQTKINKVVSLSGLLDIHHTIAERSDMKEMFEQDFGFQPQVNGEQWLNQRDPLLTIPYLKKDLPILIMQGTDDNRVNPADGKRMVQLLQENGNVVTYWEIEGGKHTLYNIPNRMDLIAHWLESHQEELSLT